MFGRRGRSHKKTCSKVVAFPVVNQRLLRSNKIIESNYLQNEKKSVELLSLRGLVTGDRDGDVTADVILWNLYRFIVLERRRRDLVDFSDDVNDFSCEEEIRKSASEAISE